MLIGHQSIHGALQHAPGHKLCHGLLIQVGIFTEGTLIAHGVGYG